MHIPRYASLATRVAQELRKQLKSEYIGGGNLPSEPEIADKYGVNCCTVRQTLGILEREGIILRRQGAGTFADKYILRIKVRADIAYEVTELLRIAGYEASIQPLIIERHPMGKEIAKMLEIDPTTVALVVCELFSADSQPDTAQW
jgi:GntR family transcriptional regulator